MKKSTMNLVIGSLLSAAGIMLLIAAYKNKQSEEYKVLEDHDIRNSSKIDQMESVDADKVPEEKGLTQYDSILRAEWVANGFPQTHQEMRELEELEKH